MEQWAVVFDNNIDHPGLRDQQHRDAHHAYLTEHHDQIRLAGAVSDDKGKLFTGGMWLVEAETRETVQRLAEGSPFYQSGVHATYRLVWWGSAPGFENMILTEG